MALHAQKGLSRGQQFIMEGAVRSMAIHTIFSNITMLKDEGP
jgi:hypothetical protein